MCTLCKNIISNKIIGYEKGKEVYFCSISCKEKFFK